MSGPSTQEAEQKKKGLELSITEGSFASVMISAFDQFLVPFAVALQAAAAQIGLLRALPQLGSSFVQLFAPEITDFFRSKKKVVAAAVLFQALLWIPLIATVFWFRNVYLLIFFTALIGLFGGLAAPSWTSWMGDLVDERARGSYFARRNRITGLVAFVSIIVFGLVLNRFSLLNNVFLGFALLFAAALVGRLVSFYLITRIYEPAYRAVEESRFSFADFLRRLPFTNFGRFVIFMSLMTFAINIAAPFFAVYVLQELHYDYIQYTVFTLVSTAAAFLFMTYWGTRADRLGNRIVFTITSAAMPFLPLLWLFTTNFYLITLIQAFGNFLWVGFSMSATNFIYDAVRPEKRVRVMSYFNVLNGLAIFAGATVGGLILSGQLRSFFFTSNFHLLFFVAAVLRLAVVGVFFNRIKEVRVVDEDAPKREEEAFVRLIFVEPLKEAAGGIATRVGESISGAVEMGKLAKTVGSAAAGTVGETLGTFPRPRQLLRKTVRTLRKIPKTAGRVHRAVRKGKRRRARG